jgi:NADH-quinone oxidoreductase subunit L
MAGPTPVSALIHAATMVTAGIYLVVRCHLMYNLAPVAQQLVLFVGLATSVFAAIIGLKQNDIKKILAYSTVSQLGLMFVALGVGAYTAAMFHLTTHAFFKALLFLGSGSVIHGMHHEQDIRNMGGLKKYMPITYWTFLLGTLAICGAPFFSGFFSKDEILAEVYKHNPVLWIICLISAGITCVYMLRVFIVTFLGGFRGTEGQKQHLHESPALMTIPLILLATLSVLGGILNFPPIMAHSMAHFLKDWLQPIFPASAVEDTSMPFFTQLNLAAATFVILLVAFIYVYNKYITKKTKPQLDEEQAGIGKTIANKFYIDELYDSTIVAPLNASSELLHNKVDRSLINRLVNASGDLIQYLGSKLRKIQNGNIEYYLLFMACGVILILGFNAFAPIGDSLNTLLKIFK